MKLVHNKPIPIRKDFKRDLTALEISFEKDKNKNKKDTQKPQRVYFLWFLYLKLLLEMEEKELSFKVGIKKEELCFGKDIKINKEFYKDWDLNEVLEYPFWKWWRSHKNLFQTNSVVSSDSPKTWTPKSYFRFVRVDLRNNFTTIVNDFKKEMSDHKGKDLGGVSRYNVLGNPAYDADILKYNILVGVLNGNDKEEILRSERGRMKRTEKSLKGTIINEDNKRESDFWSQEREWKKLTPEQKIEPTFRKGVEIIRTSPEKDGKRKHYADGTGRMVNYRPKDISWSSSSYATHIQFMTVLGKRLSTYTKESLEILNGVAQGKYRKPIKFPKSV